MTGDPPYAHYAEWLIVNRDLRVETVKREINQGPFAGLKHMEITDYAAALVVAALDGYDIAAHRQWARDHIIRVRDKYLLLAEQAEQQGETDSASQWCGFARLLDREFIGGSGCVLTPFDPREVAT